MSESPPTPVTHKQLSKAIKKSAFAFRGFDFKNLGRTPELLAHEQYGPIMEKYLKLGSEICADTMQLPVDLVKRVKANEEATLNEYHESIVLIVAAELAQLEMLETFFDIAIRDANMTYGYSLGELTALVACEVLTMEDALKVPLLMSRDAVELAKETTLFILFSRSDKVISRENVHRLCTEISAEGNGVIGVSACLAPNSMLLIGQGNTFQRLKARKSEISSERVSLHRNDKKWPPMHTPIVWQRNITNRSQVLMQTIHEVNSAPATPLLSLATGDFSYEDTGFREVLTKWIDHPQLLWEAVDMTLARGVERLIHIGPAPNIIPATFSRLAANVELLSKNRLSVQTISRIAHYGWLWGILPKRATLLRAPSILQVNLEDWLLDQ